MTRWGGRDWYRMTRGFAWAGVLAAALAPQPVTAQVRWSDLVFTMGGSAERYTGNFSSVTVPVVDSTDLATTAASHNWPRYRSRSTLASRKSRNDRCSLILTVTRRGLTPRTCR